MSWRSSDLSCLKNALSWLSSAERVALSPDNSLTVASYTLYDAALRYDTRNWRFSLNVENMFDRHYVSGCQSYSVCVFGNERTVLANAKYNW